VIKAENSKLMTGKTTAVMPVNMQWTIRNTFVEIVPPEETKPLAYTMKRSASDSSLSSSKHREPFAWRVMPDQEGVNSKDFIALGDAKGFDARTDGSLLAGVNFTEKADVSHSFQFNHIRSNTLDSRNSTKTPSSSAEEEIPTFRRWDSDEEKPQSGQVVFPRSYGLKSSPTLKADPSGERSSGASDTIDPSPYCMPCAFDIEEALAFHKEFGELCAKGVDPRDAYGDVCLDKYLPLDDQGQLMSVGSIPHLCDPVGKQCKPCSAYPRGKCYRGNSCTHCHFYHPWKERNQPDVLKKRCAKQQS
jgi:hypothetical protein